jgi:lipopolysaccharide transport system ATP-binding protein
LAEVAIRCEGLSKQYRLGEREPYKALRDVLAELATAPFRHLQSSLRRTNAGPTDASRETPRIWALDDVSFGVDRGEVVAIIGRNGAGKSTLLKILSRITEPTRGQAEIHGRVGSLLEVGTGFHPELTGRENVYLNAAILGMRKAEVDRKFDEIVAFAEVDRFIDTPVKRYSSGMYVRLAFAVAAHVEPEVLLVDEVLAVGDAQFQKKCLGKMGSVAQEGRTVLFVSHNMTAVKSLCKRAVWLNHGKAKEIGDASSVVAHYLQSGSRAQLSQVWADEASAPGNDKVRIRSARVRTTGNSLDAQITVESPLELEFEFWNYQPGAVLNFTLHLYNLEGDYLFASASEAKPRPRGLLRQTLRIPGNLLNDNSHTVTIQVVQDTTNTLYLHQDVLAFEVLDGGRSGNWFGKWPGVVRPRLEWLSEVLPESAARLDE